MHGAPQCSCATYLAINTYVNKKRAIISVSCASPAKPNTSNERKQFLWERNAATHFRISFSFDIENLQESAASSTKI